MSSLLQKPRPQLSVDAGELKPRGVFTGGVNSAKVSAVYFHCIKFTIDFVSTPPKQLLALLVGAPLQTPKLPPYEWSPGDPGFYCCCCWLPVMGGFQTFHVLHGFGLTVIPNNQLELVAAASHLLEGFLLAAASCLC